MGSATDLYTTTPVRGRIYIAAMLLFISCMIAPVAYSQPYCATDKYKFPITLKCDNKKICVVKVRLQSGKYKKIYSGFARSPGWHQINDKLIQYTMSCGSPCTISIMADRETGEVSKAFEDVLAIDSRHRILARAAGTTIKLQAIFSNKNKPFTLKRDFSPVANLVADIEDIHFTQSGEMFIKYLSGSKFSTKEERIKLNLEEFR